MNGQSIVLTRFDLSRARHANLHLLQLTTLAWVKHLLPL